MWRYGRRAGLHCDQYRVHGRLYVRRFDSSTHRPICPARSITDNSARCRFSAISGRDTQELARGGDLRSVRYLWEPGPLAGLHRPFLSHRRELSIATIAKTSVKSNLVIRPSSSIGTVNTLADAVTHHSAVWSFRDSPSAHGLHPRSRNCCSQLDRGKSWTAINYAAFVRPANSIFVGEVGG